MKALRQQLALMAGTNRRVLIYGESLWVRIGTLTIHAMSGRAEEPFIGQLRRIRGPDRSDCSATTGAVSPALTNRRW
jgi:hypothetical protein